MWPQVDVVFGHEALPVVELSCVPVGIVLHVGDLDTQKLQIRNTSKKNPKQLYQLSNGVLAAGTTTTAQRQSGRISGESRPDCAETPAPERGISGRPHHFPAPADATTAHTGELQLHQTAGFKKKKQKNPPKKTAPTDGSSLLQPRLVIVTYRLQRGRQSDGRCTDSANGCETAHFCRCCTAGATFDLTG